MKRKAVVALLGLSVLLPAAAMAKVKLTVQSPYGAGPYQDAWVAIAQNYMKIHPDVSIQITAGDWGIVDQLIAAAAAGTGPDIAIITESYVGKLGWRGLLENLNPWMKSTKFKAADYFKAPMDAYTTTYKGSRVNFGLPIGYSGYGYYYNSAQFAARGLVHPEDDWGIDQFKEYLLKLTLDTNGDGKTEQYALDMQNHQNRMVGFIRSYGGDIINEDTGEYRLDDTNSIAGLQMFDDLWAKYHAVMQGGFATGQAAMYMSSAFAVAGIRSSKFDWDVCAAPSGPKGLKSVAMPTAGIAMSALSKHKAEAWSFMQYFLSREGQEIIGKLQIAIPVNIAASKVWLSTSVEQKPKHAAMFLDSVKYARPSGIAPYTDDVFAILVGKNQEAINGKIDAATVVKSVSNEIAATLKKYKARLAR